MLPGTPGPIPFRLRQKLRGKQESSGTPALMVARAIYLSARKE